MENWTLTWTRLAAASEININAIGEDLAGVYRLSYLADNGDYYVFYVGQSENIKKRLLEHLSSKEENVCMRNYLTTKKCFFRYAKVTKSYIRDAAEKQMYKRYEPSCNELEPTGRNDVKVNLT